jgi:TatD DNase family protein
LLVDTHCHLDFESFEQDRDQVITHARENGLARILNPGITYKTSHAAIQLSRRYPEVYAAVGIHPTEVKNCDPGTISMLAELLPDPKVVAIGEIGLDDYWDQSSMSQQIDCLHIMLGLAKQNCLPVIIHIRNQTRDDHKATEAAYNILSEWHQNLPPNSVLRLRPGVLHSFDDRIEWAEKFFQYNFLLGISGRITYRNAQKLREVVINAPLENLLVETDAPFVTPEPDRRKRNQPGNVKVVTERISLLRGMPYDDVATITTSNARRLFAW